MNKNTTLYTNPIICIGDIWEDHDDDGVFVVVPTNMTTKNDGESVMGRGIARQAKDRFPGIAKKYGRAIRDNKTIRGFYFLPKEKLIMIPVKLEIYQNAMIDLIEFGLVNLRKLIRADRGRNISKINIPILGTGFGGLSYEEAMPTMLMNYRKPCVIYLPNDSVYGNERYRESFLPANNNKKDKKAAMSRAYTDICI